MSRISLSLCALVLCSLPALGQSSAAVNVLGQPGTSVTVGAGCSTTDMTPALVSTAPRIGQTVTIAVGASYPGAVGYLFLGAPLGSPAVLASGCTVYLDLNTAMQVGPFQLDAAGTWIFTAPVDVPQSYAGQNLSLQAAVITDERDPLKLTHTNALLWTFGF